MIGGMRNSYRSRTAYSNSTCVRSKRRKEHTDAHAQFSRIVERDAARAAAKDREAFSGKPGRDAAGSTAEGATNDAVGTCQHPRSQSGRSIQDRTPIRYLYQHVSGIRGG